MQTKPKLTLCVDFDGVIHSYRSGWQGATVISDPPVPGAIEALHAYLEHFEVAIYSARSAQEGGIRAMRNFINIHDTEYLKRNGCPGPEAWSEKCLINRLLFPTSKPAAVLYIDDRGLRFEGVFPDIQTLKESLVPWYKK